MAAVIVSLLEVLNDLLCGAALAASSCENKMENTENPVTTKRLNASCSPKAPNITVLPPLPHPTFQPDLPQRTTLCFSAAVVLPRAHLLLTLARVRAVSDFASAGR